MARIRAVGLDRWSKGVLVLSGLSLLLSHQPGDLDAVGLELEE